MSKAIIAAREVDGNEQAADFDSQMQIVDGALKITLQPLAMHAVALKI